MLFNALTTVLAALYLTKVAATGPAAVDLGTAGGFTILAKSGISTVPPSSITGNIGVSPIAATGLTGFSLTMDRSGTFSTSTQVIGKVFAATYTSPTPSQLTTAVSDMETAFTNATGRVNPDFTNLATGLIGGLTLRPGLYTWSTGVNAATGFTISGTSTDTWIFQVANTLTVGTGVRVTLSGGALAKNIVWVVSSSVTLGVGSHFEGVLLGKTSITAQTGATINGRLLAQTNVALQLATVTA
ncbi:antifreeze protein [Agrocybe pediades]|nr:antifreeze protein [Agrocybe pediades]